MEEWKYEKMRRMSRMSRLRRMRRIRRMRRFRRMRMMIRMRRMRRMSRMRRMRSPSTKLSVRSAVICSILTENIVAFSGEWVTGNKGNGNDTSPWHEKASPYANCRRSIPNKTGMGGWEAPRELPEIFFKDLRVSILSARQDNYIHIKE